MRFTEWQTTLTLISDLKDPNAQTCWSLVAEHFGSNVEAFAQRERIPVGDVPDVVQEVLIAVCTGIRAGKFDPEKGRLRDWIYGIARRQVLSCRRANAARSQRNPRLETSIEENHADDSAESALKEAWDQDWEHSVVRRSTSRLRRAVEPDTYEVFRSLSNGMQPVEVSEQLGFSLSKVYNCKSRAMKLMRQFVREYDGARE